MPADLDTELGKLLDQYEEKHRAVEDRRRQVRAEEEDFQRRFSNLRDTVVRPVFEAAGALLKKRGLDFSIAEEQYASEPGGKTTEAAIAIRVVPAGASTQREAGFPTLSFATRHYSKAVCINSSNAVPHSDERTSPRGDFQLAQINRELVEEELLKLIAGMVKR